jgi:thiosulfate dehydrogenase [quinone] large subunit
LHWIGSSSWIGSVDLAIALALTVVGLSLMLGLFTQVGCSGALVLLATFYLSAVPIGEAAARGEGTYLLVNKNLIEACAVALLWTFRTGSIAGFDRFWLDRGWTTSPVERLSAQEAAL